MTLFKTLDDADLPSKRVLTRVDLNVPMKDGAVSDATRIDRVLPTIREIADKGGRVILLAHFGRPKGKRDASQSLEPVAAGTALLVLVAVLYARATGRRYPFRQFHEPNPNGTTDPPAVERLGLTEQELSDILVRYRQSMNLGVDPKHADQMVRGVCNLPNGSGRTQRVAVFAKGAKAEEAKAAGADVVGAEDLVEQVGGRALARHSRQQPQRPLEGLARRGNLRCRNRRDER